MVELYNYKPTKPKAFAPNVKAMSHEAIFLATCNAMALHCKFQGRLPRVTPHVSQRKIALQVAEKVEAASTFRNATRQVAACDIPHCNMSRNFF